MGINAKDLALLIRVKEANRIPARGAVVEIGAQQLDNSFLRNRSDVARMGALFGVSGPSPLPGPVPTHLLEGGIEHLSETAPFARVFWQWLGFEYASVDVDGSPGSIPLDLNFDDVPGAQCGKYHLVTNFGTTEHVANQLNAFKIIHDLAVPGGVMIHDLPAQGHINHGLVNYNPKFFWMLARSNDYRWFYFDYREVESGTHGLPQNLVDDVSRYERDFMGRGQNYRLIEANMVVALQKRFDSPFVPPLDLPDSAVISEALADRYRMSSGAVHDRGFGR